MVMATLVVVTIVIVMVIRDGGGCGGCPHGMNGFGWHVGDGCIGQLRGGGSSRRIHRGTRGQNGILTNGILGFGAIRFHFGITVGGCCCTKRTVRQAAAVGTGTVTILIRMHCFYDPFFGILQRHGPLDVFGMQQS